MGNIIWGNFYIILFYVTSLFMGESNWYLKSFVMIIKYTVHCMYDEKE